MAMTSTTTKTNTGTTISVFNNGVIYQASYYDTKFKVVKTAKFDSLGNVNTYETYQYSGNKVVETDKFNAYNQLTEILKYTYNGNKIDNVTHYDANGNLKLTDIYVNNVLDHSVAPLTSGWSNISGNGSIDVLKALTSALGHSIADVVDNTINWALKSAHFEDAWNAGYTGKGQVIAVIDSGIDLNNKDLTAHISKDSYNFVANNTNIQDDFGHGSFVASEIISSRNSDGITGGAYDAELMVLKTANNVGSATPTNVVKAIMYAVDHGADIINLSLNSVLAQPTIKTALDYAKQHDVLVSVSSGNNLANTPNYPAIYATTNHNVVSVGATFNMNNSEVFNTVSSKAGSNSVYNYVDAGGTNITGYNQSGQIVTMSGTSMAAPLVASEMAILKQAIESLGQYTSNVIDDMVMDYVTNNTHGLQLIGVSAITGVDNLIA